MVALWTSGCKAQEDTPEVAGHIEALVVAVEHVDCATLQPRLPIQLTQKDNGACQCNN